ncbi:MAG TPA: pitrilysin family protein [Nitrospiraceae bacterium]|nr:pitrilysin family protein [Nitrospiraceae bacterium]
MYRKVVLDNGVRVVTERMPSAKSVTVGVWVNVGSRDEEKGEEGFSHFIEHMFFKGTRTRSAMQISREIDALGGEMNAFTGRETTTFYVKVLDQHLSQALALLSDLFHHAKFASKEIEKEKQVVLEEVRMVEDDPEDLAQDWHMEQALNGHPLGRPILGQAAVIRGLRRERLLHFVEAHYHPGETVISVAGNFHMKELVPLLSRYFGNFTKPQRPKLNRWPPEIHAGLYTRRKPLQQAHLCLGLKGLRLDHKDRYALHALNAAVGGSVSSRLFQEVREKRGLAYSIYSYASSYSDTGALTIYAATRPREAARVIDLVRREMKRFHQQGIDRQELQRVKEQIKGGLMLSVESTQSRMSKLAKDELYHGRHLSLEEMTTEIDRISGNQILRLAHELFNSESLSVAVLGPISRRTLQSVVN